MTVPSRNSDQFNLRMPQGIRDRIQVEADKNSRSMNSEIVARLEASFNQARSIDPVVSKAIEDFVNAEVAARLQEIARKIGGAA